MLFQIDALRGELKNNVGELTAAVLLIPFAVTFQNLALAMINSAVDLNSVFFGLGVLTLFLMLSFINIVMLSVSVAGIQHFDWRGRLSIIVMIPSFLMIVLIVGAVADPQAVSPIATDLKQDILQCGLLAFVLPPLVIRILVNWGDAPRRSRFLNMVSVLDCLFFVYIVIVLVQSTTVTLFDQPTFPFIL